MKYTVKFQKESLNDFEKGNAYYKKISSDLADKFFQSFKEKIGDIEEQPLHYQLKYKNIRIAHLKHFPFSIHFIIEKTSIYILRVLHQKRCYK